MEITPPVVRNVTNSAHYRLAVLLVLMSSLINSTGGLLLRSIEAAGPWHVLFYRQGTLAVCLMVVLALRCRGQVVAEFKGIGSFGLVAGLVMGAASTCFILALVNTTIANTLFILSAAPFITAVLAWVWLKEPVRRGTWGAMAFALAGIAIMVGGGLAAGSIIGNVLALFTVFGFSCFVVLLRRGRATNMIPAVVIGSTIAATFAAFNLGGDFLISWHDLAICIFWGSCVSTIVHILFVWSSRFLRGAEIMLLILVEFVLGPLWVWIFVGEVPRNATLLGGIFVLTAVMAHAVISMRTDKLETKSAVAN